MTITSEDFVKLKFLDSPTLSPDGKKLVFSIKKVNQKKNQFKSSLYIRTAEKKQIRQYSLSTYTDTSPQFSPSGEYLAFLSSREEKLMQVFVMSVEGGEAIRVTNFPRGVMGFRWSHDGKLIHVIARVSEEELELILNPKEPPSFVLDSVKFKEYKTKKKQQDALKIDPRVLKSGYYREGTAYLDSRFTQPFVVDISEFDQYLEKEEPMKAIHLGENGFHFSLGTFNLDDTAVFLSKFKEDPTVSLEQEILKVNVSDPEDKKILGTAFGLIENFQLSPSGRYFFFEAIREEKIVYDDSQIFLFDLEKESSDFICITEDYNRSANQSRWIDENNILFLSPSDGKKNIHNIDILTKKVVTVVEGDRNVNSFAISANGTRLAYEVSHASFPSDIFWSNVDGSDEERITEVNKNYLESQETAEVEAFTYERDGVKFQGWILFPSGYSRQDKIPVVLEIHGGPNAMWTPHERTMWHEWNTLTSKGYAVVFCNPRGSDGYGIEFRSAVFKNWGDLAANDILEALDCALMKYPSLDSDKIAVTGGSYGGYMTSWLVTHTNRFKAAISQRGVYEFVAFGTTTDIPIWFEKQYEGEIIDQLFEIWKDSPAAHIKNLQTPLLIIHSENDFRVPIVNAEQLYWLGKRYGKVIEFVRYPRDGHELSRSGEPRHIIDRINRIINWIEKYIKSNS